MSTKPTNRQDSRRRLQRRVRRAAARTLKRLKEETVLRPIGPICCEEWQCCRDIIAEEMAKLLPNDQEDRPPECR